ncbi:MAG: hypothetical protein ABIO67_06035, partial [Mycobacteriales bacterium]
GGRPQRPAGGRPVRAPRRPPSAPHAGQGSDWPTRSASPNPDDDEAFLRSLRKRAEEQRRRAAERKPDEPPPAGV